MYILLAFMFYAIILNCMAITLCRTIKPQQRPISRQNATHCRACNVLLIEHNHACNFERKCNYTCETCNIRGGCHTWLNRDIEAVKTQINIKEVDMSKYCEICGESYFTHNGDGSCINDRELEIENQLLSDYLKYRELVMELPSLTMGKCADCAIGYEYCNMRDICNSNTARFKAELPHVMPTIEHIDGDADDNETANLTLTHDKQTDFELITSGLDAGQPISYDQSLTWTEQIRQWQEREDFTIYPKYYLQGIVLLRDDVKVGKFYAFEKGGIKKLVTVEKIKKTRKSKIGVC